MELMCRSTARTRDEQSFGDGLVVRAGGHLGEHLPLPGGQVPQGAAGSSGAGGEHGLRVLEFNPAASSTFGYRREEALGRELAELVIPDSFGPTIGAA